MLFRSGYVFWQSKRDAPPSVLTQWVEPLTQRVAGAEVPSSATSSGFSSESSSLTKDSPTTTTVVSTALDTSHPTAPGAAPSPAVVIAPVTSNAPSAAVSPTSPAVAVIPSAAQNAKTDQPAPTKAATAVPAPAPTAPPSDNKNEKTSAKNESADCASIKGDPVPTKSVLASKPGNYVYLLASKPVQICIEDAQRHRFVVALEAGVGRSVHGNPPWVLASSHLKSVQIYFQGAKVVMPAEAENHIILKEQSVSP